REITPIQPCPNRRTLPSLFPGPHDGEFANGNADRNNQRRRQSHGDKHSQHVEFAVAIHARPDSKINLRPGIPYPAFRKWFRQRNHNCRPPKVALQKN
ncbi:MAG: hypothetical protein J0H30_13500, partial [Alphaproteobacteria bacterium]|nr:hypothetical protein [Alphaproteobacteria bacterium]